VGTAIAGILIIEEDKEVRRQVAAVLRAGTGVTILECATVEKARTALGDARASIIVIADNDRFADPWIKDSSGKWVDLEALVVPDFRNILKSRVVLYRSPLDELALLRDVRELLAPVPICPE
jgi:hypothetical protein